jgi:hypothetical protein
MTTSISLPFSTAECDEGPIANCTPGRLTLRYDADGEYGTVWTRLEFNSALASRFTPDPACDERMVHAYSRVDEDDDSRWIADLRNSAKANGAHLPASLRHFTVYFDHVGCWEVAADTMTISPER